MTCKYCNGKLAPLRSLTDGEFCSDEHRKTFDEEQIRATGEPEPHLTMAFEAGPAQAASQPFIKYEPVPGETAAPLPAEATATEPETPPAPVPRRKRPHPASWLLGAWQTAPFELNALMILLPILLTLVASPNLHKVGANIQKGDPNDLRVRTRQVITDQWKDITKRISNRAAIAITDDFRSGLDFWESRSNLTKSWSFDANGFVQPGPLALLTPTEDLSDYSFEFLGEIERHGMGAAFRARDLDNYYAIKFVRDDSGSLPGLLLVRYPVIHGKEGPHVERAVPSSIRADRMNRFRVEAHGGDFTVLVDGEVVDAFSDTRLKTGGVGFFCSRGEKARLRWVEVSHQFDTLGKVCAYFAPLGLAGVDKD
jgi:hypothetical protein